jgi:glycosyltransferase involved in cell wall biosynthesis
MSKNRESFLKSPIMKSGLHQMNVSEVAAEIIKKHRVATIHDWLTVMGGAEEVAKVMYQTMPTPLYAAQYNPERMKWAQDAEVHTHWINRLPFSKTKHYLYAPFLADAYRAFDLREYDLLITTSHTFAHHARGREEVPHLVYYHTPARSLWMPEIDGRAGTGVVRNVISKRLRRLDLESSRNFTFAVGNSKTIVERLERVYGRPVDGVLYPGVDVEKFEDVPRSSDEEGYVMWSRLIPYKKFDLAIQAALLGGFKLNIVGAGPYDQALKEMAGGAKNIVFHGRLADTDLKSLLSRARGVIFPAYEDFGIVPVEAMAAGLPVVVYAQGGAAETVTSEYGEHIQQQTGQDIWDAVQRMEKKSYDSTALKTHAHKFRLERFNQELLQYVQSAIERGGHRRFQ